MKLALYRHAKYDYEQVWALYSDGTEPSLTEYVRISEWLDVTFQPLDAGDVTAKMVAALDAERGKVANEFGDALAKIDRRKAELLALPAPVAAS